MPNASAASSSSQPKVAGMPSFLQNMVGPLQATLAAAGGGSSSGQNNSNNPYGSTAMTPQYGSSNPPYSSSPATHQSNFAGALSAPPAYAATTSSQPYSSTPPAYTPTPSYYSGGMNKPGDYSNTSTPYAQASVIVPSYVSTGTSSSAVYKGGPTNGIVSEGNPTICQKVDYEIKGLELQLVEIELDPNETVIAEAGSLMYLEEGINFETKFGDGSNPKPGFFNQLLSAGGRLLTGESLFLTHFTNAGHQKARVAFAAPFPGNIVPINMQTTGGRLICEKDAFLCAAKGTKLTIHFNKKLGSGFFGGEGFIMQRLEGDGMAFIHAGGTVIRRELRNEKLRLDTGCLVAMTDGINFDIQMVPGLKSIVFGGEGIFLATLQGTGTVWMQSLPLSRFADRIVKAAPSIGGRRQGETDFVASAGSALGGALRR
jgi:uncharacterized protein (TIGR00266 family)